MFGFVSKLAGGFLDKLGLSFLKPIVSFGLNALTGNYVGMIGDIKDMYSQFKDSGFLNKAAKHQPVGDFARDFITRKIDNFVESQIDRLTNHARNNGLRRAESMLDLVNEYRSSSSQINAGRTCNHYSALMG